MFKCLFHEVGSGMSSHSTFHHECPVNFHVPGIHPDVAYPVVSSYFPDCSTQVNKRYPVIYFLQGAGGSEAADAGGFSS